METAARSKTLIQLSFWLSAVLVGCLGVLFERVFAAAQHLYFELVAPKIEINLFLTPVLFLVSTALVVLVAPQAKGSGIPQAMKASLLSMGSHQSAIKSGLVSLRTATIKVVSTTLGIIGGASIGREGPTVQIAASLFAYIGSKTKKIFPQADFHSYLVAGGAAGVSAAFNTPIAGITFALEEMASGSFARIKTTVMLSVIIAGIVSQTLVGNYRYFGSPILTAPEVNVVIPAILIGIGGGLFGGFFAKMIAFPIFNLGILKKITWWQRALICGVIVLGINLATQHQSAGTGYEITREFMDSENGTLDWKFTLGKYFATIFSFLSGMAGGVFSPSLAIGSGFGAQLGDWIGVGSVKLCALFGMVAFFTGAIQAPLTGVIIVMEMTDKHEIILPLMISAFAAQLVSRAIMPTSLYHYLAFKRK